MDANRNFSIYISDNSKKIDDFIGNANWRQPFKQGQLSPQNFIKYLADIYDDKMKALGYVEPVTKHLIRTDEKVPLYYLAFYSKHPRGNDFYQKVEKYLSAQQSMF